MSLFQAQFSPAELILSNLSPKNDSRGVRGHAPPGKKFQKFDTAIAILVLFIQFLGKACQIFGS